MPRTLIRHLLLLAAVIPVLAAAPASQPIDIATARQQLEEAQRRLDTASQRAAAAQQRLDHQMDIEDGLANEAHAAQSRVDQIRAAAGQSEARSALAARDAKEAGMRIDKLTAAQPLAQARLEKARGDVKDLRDRAVQVFHASAPYTSAEASIEAENVSLNDELDGVRRELADRADYQALQDAADSTEAIMRQLRNARSSDPVALAAANRAWMSAIEAVAREQRENDDADYFVIEARKSLVAARSAMTQLVAKFEKDLLAVPGMVALNTAVAVEQAKVKQIATDLVDAKNDVAAAQAATQKNAAAAQETNNRIAEAERQVQNLNGAMAQSRDNELWAQLAADKAASAAETAWFEREVAAKNLRDAIAAGPSHPSQPSQPGQPGQPSTQPSPTTPPPVATTQQGGRVITAGDNKGAPGIDPQSPGLIRPTRTSPGSTPRRQPVQQAEVVDAAPIDNGNDATDPVVSSPPVRQNPAPVQPREIAPTKAPDRSPPAKDNSDKTDPAATTDNPGLERPGAPTPSRSRKQ